MYLDALEKDMPTGRSIRWRHSESDSELVSDTRNKYTSAYSWMNYLNSRGANIKHKLNAGKEVRYGSYFYDGHEVTENEIRVNEFHG